MRGSIRNACFIAALTAAGASLAADPAPAEPAVWKTQEADFTYQGFTTRYSCDGLYDKLKHILIELGARQDKSFELSRSGCTEASGRPEPFPGVHVKMVVLAPAAAGDSGAVPARWKPVKLGGGLGYFARGDCELLEQVKQKIVPLFATRNVQLNANCIPHQATASTPLLTLDVLAPDQATPGPR